jgi:hypothetical protein
MGYRVLTNQVKAAIERFWPDLAGPELKAPFPDWMEINGVEEELPAGPSAVRKAVES